MNNRRRKLIAPVIITVILIAILGLYIGIIAAIPKVPVVFKVLGAVYFIVSAAVIIGVLSSRIKEIRSGEEDDLSKY